MRDSIKRAILELFPELSGGLHVDRYARVLAVADAPEQGSSSERFRPRYAVDIEILGPDMEPDAAFPTYTAVPLPVPVGAGQEMGTFAFPEAGALVVVGFAYGRADHPLIRQAYALGASLPQVAQGELLQQQSPTVYQLADAAGNWTRTTDTDITDDSVTRTVKAEQANTQLGNESRTICQHSIESVGGMKTVEAGTLLTMLGGLRVDVGSLGTVNVTAGKDSTYSTAGESVETVGQNHTSTVKGNRLITIQGNHSQEIAGTNGIHSVQELVIASDVSITLRAPRIILEGILSHNGYEGAAPSSTLRGNLTVLDGNIAAPGNDVSAGAVSLRGHVHPGVQSGGGNTSTPVGG